MYWSVRREFWENRSIYIAPLVAAAVFLSGFLISLISLPRTMRGLSALDPAKQRAAIEAPYDTVAALIMAIAIIVGVFYCLDALYGERRDRSILFWKSLPVSDLTTVLSKLTIPLVILPLLSFVITVVTQFIMLLLSSVVLLGSGLGVATLWTQTSFFHVSLGLLSHLVIIHGLWYAPLYGWLLLVSAGSPRAPFVWAFLPPFVICAVEKMAFNTSHFAAMLLYRATGPEPYTPAAGGTMMDMIPALPPLHFFSTQGLWNGLALAVGFLAAAVWLRRYRGPI
jgi:ABC-2 type transport system permease protein